MTRSDASSTRSPPRSQANQFCARYKGPRATGLIEAETPEEQIAEALSRAIIDEDEASKLRAADAARFDAITVDEFPSNEFGRSTHTDDAPDDANGRKFA